MLKYFLNDKFICDINGLGLLSIEQTRTGNKKFQSDATFFAKEDQDLFVEKEWKEMKEPIPKGPQAISLDIGFGSLKNVYGIPERINSFEVKSTVEYKAEDGGALIEINEEEPFRLYTCDHFNDKYPNHSQYGAVPIMHVRAENSKAMLGLYWCNASDTFVDILNISG